MLQREEVELLLLLQREEVQAVQAIFATDETAVSIDFAENDDEFPSTSILLVTLQSCDGKTTYISRIQLPPQYPTSQPPEIKYLSPSLIALLQSRASLADLPAVQAMLTRQWSECRPNGVIYLHIDWLLQFLPPLQTQSNTATNNYHNTADLPIQIDNTESDQQNQRFQIHSSKEPLIDRKSIFMAHLCRLESTHDIPLIMDQLRRQQPKIHRATHNIIAYRTERLLNSSSSGGGGGGIDNCGRAVIEEDYDDDGETAAGGRLLRLLQLCDCRKVLVVVSRWYGGIQLGSDRFKHINDCARELLRQHGYCN